MRDEKKTIEIYSQANKIIDQEISKMEKSTYNAYEISRTKSFTSSLLNAIDSNLNQEPKKECGKVKCFSDMKGFGFIISESCPKDIFFHISNVLGEENVHKEDKVEFFVCETEKGYEAKEICLIYMK